MKKYLISADIEGISGIFKWSQTERNDDGYAYYQERMNKEVNAVCEALLEAGDVEITVVDGHGDGLNIAIEQLPLGVTLLKGFNYHPQGMLFGIDETFDGVFFIGYHSKATANGHPLAHTLSTDLLSISINDKFVSEADINLYTAAYFTVPVLFLSGDLALTQEINEAYPWIETVSTHEGIGNAVKHVHPDIIINEMKEAAKKAMNSSTPKPYKLPDNFVVDLTYKNHTNAYKYSFYPGMKQISGHTLRFETKDYYEVLRMLTLVAF